MINIMKFFFNSQIVYRPQFVHSFDDFLFALNSLNLFIFQIAFVFNFVQQQKNKSNDLIRLIDSIYYYDDVFNRRGH